MLILLGCLGMVALVVISVLLRAYVLHILWGWFLTPIVHVAPPSLVLLVGLTIVVGMFLPQTGVAPVAVSKQPADNWEAVSKFCSKAFLSPLVTLVFGAIVHHFA